ncbi:MAG TPA: hypothetical protein VKZ76_03275 [Edaphocola sp.]|nr:hypothetical protein [Edaphocola sp.]
MEKFIQLSTEQLTSRIKRNNRLSIVLTVIITLYLVAAIATGIRRGWNVAQLLPLMLLAFLWTNIRSGKEMKKELNKRQSSGI